MRSVFAIYADRDLNVWRKCDPLAVVKTLQTINIKLIVVLEEKSGSSKTVL